MGGVGGVPGEWGVLVERQWQPEMPAGKKGQVGPPFDKGGMSTWVIGRFEGAVVGTVVYGTLA